MKAVWNGAILAESETTVEMEGDLYFPPDALRMEYLRPSRTMRNCPSKGLANYYDIIVGDEENLDAAWYYERPNVVAHKIKGLVAFWKGVEIIE